MHYLFRSKRQFETLRDTGDLLEWAEVHGNYYGTPREPVEKALSEGRDVLFDIDWQGTRQLLEKMRDDVVTVFVLPPTARSSRSVCRTPSRRSRIGANTTTSWSTATSTRASRACAPSSPPSVSSA